MEKITLHHHDHDHVISVDTNNVLGRELTKLHYFYEHNRSHIQELEETRQVFSENNSKHTADLLAQSLDLLKQVNVLLEHALQSVEEK